jgi:glyoxylase-like metal-dependent hydrolase (beta-lactamase superfamily II)
MNIEAFYDPRTFTLSYVVSDPNSKNAIAIDPVLDYDILGAHTYEESVAKMAAFVEAQGLTLTHIFETHAHADHLTGAQRLKRRFPSAKVVIGSEITKVQEVFRGLFDLGDELPIDGSQFDVLLGHGESIDVGGFEVKALHTPGHTPACACYVVGDAVFTGDTIFMPDQGTGRCDFPAGSSEALYRSIFETLYGLPDETRVFVGHDYQPGGRPVRWESTIGEQKRSNIHLRGDTTLAEFVAFRDKRDATLSAPRLIFQSVQVNANAGHLPTPAENGMRYLKTPLNVWGEDPNADA